MDCVHIEIKDKGGNLVNEYYVHRLSVRDNFERVVMNKKIAELDEPDEVKGHYFTCASLAVALKDKDGKRIFDGDDAHKKLESEMDFEEYGLLIKHYLDVNPLEPSLDAKKKKS